MVKVITNASGDYIVVLNDGENLHEGHSIGAFDLVMILQNLGIQSEHIEITDTEMEELV